MTDTGTMHTPIIMIPGITIPGIMIPGTTMHGIMTPGITLLTTQAYITAPPTIHVPIMLRFMWLRTDWQDSLLTVRLTEDGTEISAAPLLIVLHSQDPAATGA